MRMQLRADSEDLLWMMWIYKKQLRFLLDLAVWVS